MKVRLIGESDGIHETRFIKAFRERGHECHFMSCFDLRETRQDIDINFGGPLQHGFSLKRDLGSVPYVAVSYAYDLLWLAERSAVAKNAVSDALAASCGMLADCEKVKECAVRVFSYTKPILVRAWGLNQDWRSNRPTNEKHKSLLGSTLTVVSARNFTPLHAIPDLIRGFSLAVRNGANLRMVVAGDGEERSEIVDLINELDLGKRIRLIGKVKEQQLQEILEKSDIYVSASRIDGTSITLLQALAAGLPVVLSNVGGNTEWAERIQGAVLFKSGDIERLATHLSELADNRVRIRFDRSKVLEELCDWHRNADDIVNFCSHLAAVS